MLAISRFSAPLAVFIFNAAASLRHTRSPHLFGP
jgi:hypothetical protein